MRKALATFGVGDEHQEYMTYSRPLFQAYARRHDYTYIEAPIVFQERPPSWHKVQALTSFLGYYDAVLWLDSDVVIVDESRDLADDVPTDAWQALACHTEHHGTDLGHVPNCGVWFVRRPMLPILRQVWGMTQYAHHPWWEQAAMHELMGFASTTDALTPVTHQRDTELYQHTHFLDETWNCVDTENNDATPRFMHMCGLPHIFRLGEMEYWAKRAMEGLRVMA